MKTAAVKAFLFSIFLSIQASSQAPFYKTYTLPGGAATPNINCLYQEKRGYILVGASTGLYRFDGISFHKITAEKDTLHDVTAICETKDGKIWLGFGDGKLGWLQNNKIVLQDPEEGFPSKAIKKIVQDTAGVVWIATAGEGIYYFKDNHFYNINTDDGLSDNYVYDLALTRLGLSAGTDRGINNIRISNTAKYIQSYTSKDGLPDNIIRTLINAPTTYNDLWLAMQDAGIAKGFFEVVDKNDFYCDYMKNWRFGQINSLLARDRYLYAASESHGLIRFETSEDSWILFQNPEVLVQQKLTTLLHDSEGNIWAAGNNQLIRTNGSKLQPVINLPPTEATNLHTLLVDKEDHIWMNVRKGLKHLGKNEDGVWVERIYNLPVTINSQITALYEDNFDNIWIGTMGNGAFILDSRTGRFRKITENKLLLNASVLSITGKNGQVWIASFEGATKTDLSEANKNIDHPLAIQDFTAISDIGTNYIYNIYVDSKGRTWFATDGKGIAVYENGKITSYGQAQGLKSEVVYQVTEDPQGNIWFTTFNGGVVKFDGRTFTHFGLAEGLSDLNITSLASDKNGNLYIGHRTGLDIIDTRTGVITYLDAEQGLKDINTDLNAIATNRNGDIYFISNDAIYKYASSQAAAKPKVIIDRIQLFLADVEVENGHVFASDEDNISFYYTGLFYSQPNKVQYQYKLEGYNEEWVTTNDRRRDFPRLPPGTYTFRVRASLNNNFVNAPESSFTFTIQKPVWMRWWFIALCILLTGIVLYWYVKDREKRLQKWERLEKEKIQSQFETLRNQVNPHFLFNSFNTLVSEIEEDPKRAVQYVEHMADFFRSIVTYREKDVITLAEEIGIIRNYLFIQRKRYGNAFQVNISITPQEEQQYFLAPLTLQLLAENAIKHNAILKEKPLLLEIFVEAEQLVVRNNVSPKLHPEKSAGLGLQNILKRYELLTKKNVMVSHDDEYFTVIIPLIKKADGTSTDHRR